LADWKTLYEKWDALSLEMREKLFVSMDKKAREKTEDFKKWLLEDPYREKVYFEKFSNTRRFILQNPSRTLEPKLEKPTEEAAAIFPTSVPVEPRITPLVSEGNLAVLPKVTASESVSEAPQPKREEYVEKAEKPSSVPTIVKISRGKPAIDLKTPKTASLMPEQMPDIISAEPIVTPELEAAVLPTQKTVDTSVTPSKETPTIPSPKPEVPSGNRVVFLLKKPITTISANRETTTDKVVFVLDNKETYLPKSEIISEASFAPTLEIPFSAKPESEETKLSPKTSLESVPQVTFPLTAPQKKTGENLIFIPPETTQKAPFTETTAPYTPTLTEAKAASPQAVESAQIAQPQSVMPKQLFSLQLDTKTDISQLLNRLNREKDLLVAINSQECWRCKSTEKTLVNYIVGVDKAEIKLTCNKCGATTTLNHEGGSQ